MCQHQTSSNLVLYHNNAYYRSLWLIKGESFIKLGEF